MPPNMEKFYDPKFDLGDEEDKERFHIYFSLALSKILIPDSGIWIQSPDIGKIEIHSKYDEEEEVKFYLDMQDKFLFLITAIALFVTWGVFILRSLVEQ